MKHFNLFKRLLLPVVAMLLTFQAGAQTRTVGPGGYYADLTTAIADLNIIGSGTPGLTQAFVLNVLPGSYSGTGWNGVINNLNGASATNNVTIQALNGPGTVTITQTGTALVPYIIRLNGSSFINIKNLTFVNTSTATNGINLQLLGAASDINISGCSFASGVTAATVDNMALIQAGTNATALLGTSARIGIYNNTFTNGSAAVWMYGGSDNFVDNGVINNPAYYGLNVNGTTNFKARGNTITTTVNGFLAGTNMSSTKDGIDVSTNTINISVTSGSPIGMMNSSINSSTTTPANPTTINNNTVNVTVTTGVATSLSNNSCYGLTMNNNTFNANATTSGVITPAGVLNTCTNSVLTNNRFRNIAVTGGIATSGSFNFANNCVNSKFNYNTWYDSTTTGGLYTTASILWANAANGFNCDHNNFRRVSSGAGTFGSTNSSNTTSGYYNAQNCTFNADTVLLATASTASSYTGIAFLASYYNMYTCTNMQVDSGVYTLNSLGSTGIYGIFGYVYGCYGGTNITFNRNVFNFNIASALGTCYGLGYYMGYSSAKFHMDNNIINVNGGTSGTMYPLGYITIYTGTASTMNNNVLNTNGSTGLTYYVPGYLPGTGDTAVNNILNVTTTTGSIIAYMYYAGGIFKGNTLNYTTTSGSITMYGYYSTGLFEANNFNASTTTGTIQFPCYYQSGSLWRFNNFRGTTTSGTIYGLYDYGSTSYSGGTYQSNLFDLRSGTGAVYGYYGGSTPNGTKLVSNVFITKTAGTSYLYYNTSAATADVALLHNTFHSNSTGNTNQLIYSTVTSGSKLYLYNNIFSRSNATNTSGADIQLGDSATYVSDYNLSYAPTATFTLKSSNPAVTATTMAGWRAGTGRDKNSLFYDPGYTDPTTNDLRPNVANPNSWSVAGRGNHIAGDTLDMAGNLRPKTRFLGVPDLGAYEINTPSVQPPDATAVPAIPVANTRQSFLFGGDSVLAIDWGAVVPASISVKQYTGVQAAPMPYAGVNRMYNYVGVTAPLGVYSYKPYFLYKDPQVGDIDVETNARLARSANGGTWAGYNYTTGITDIIRNSLTVTASMDSLPAFFTGVQNARIGTRCLVTPSGLAHGAITAYTATESWDPVFQPAGYQIAIDKTGSPVPDASSPIYFTNTNNFQIGTASALLTEFTKYYVHVRTICGSLDTSGWSLDSFTTLITCHKPDLKVKNITSSQALVYWDSIRTATGFEYVLDQSSADPAFGTPLPTAFWLNQGLYFNTTYYFHVRALCSTMYNKSDWSMISFTTLWNTGVENVNGNNAGLVTYPNPVKDILTIASKTAPDGNATITITDVTGKLVHTAIMTGQKLELNMAGMAPGMYNVKYTDNSRTEVIKVTRQ